MLTSYASKALTEAQLVSRMHAIGKVTTMRRPLLLRVQADFYTFALSS